MKKKILIAAILILIGGSTYYFLNAMSESEIDIETANVHSEITAVNLLASYEQDEKNANKSYAGEVIQVRGQLIDVKNIDDLKIQVALKTDSDMGNVVCNFENKKQVSLDKLKIGEIINVKGLCTGYLFDVILDRCIIINE